MGEKILVNIHDLKECPIQLRPVDRRVEEYHGLVDSIRNKGFIGTLSCRLKNGFYEVVDGLHRWYGAKDAGHKEIWIEVLDIPDLEVLEFQVMANLHRIPTTSMEYSTALKIMMKQNPGITICELGAKIGKGASWVHNRLSLLQIKDESIIQLIQDGEILLANAYGLSKIPPKEQDDWVIRAMVDDPREFVPACNKRSKEIREQKIRGRPDPVTEFQPLARLRGVKALKKELDSGADCVKVCRQLEAKTPEEGFVAGLKWVLHLDPDEVERSRRKFEKHIKKRT